MTLGRVSRNYDDIFQFVEFRFLSGTRLQNFRLIFDVAELFVIEVCFHLDFLWSVSCFLHGIFFILRILFFKFWSASAVLWFLHRSSRFAILGFSDHIFGTWTFDFNFRFFLEFQSLIGSRQRGQIRRVARRLWTVKIGRFSRCIWSSPFLLRFLNFRKLKQIT